MTVPQSPADRSDDFSMSPRDSFEPAAVPARSTAREFAQSPPPISPADRDAMPSADLERTLLAADDTGMIRGQQITVQTEIGDVLGTAER